MAIATWVRVDVCSVIHDTARIDERDSLQDAGNAKCRERQRRRLDRVQQQAEGEEDRGAADDVVPHRLASAAPRQRERNRGTHREQQEREHEIGECPPVPQRVLELRIDGLPRPRRADQDHPGDCQPAKHVERLESGLRHPLRTSWRPPVGRSRPASAGPSNTIDA